MWAQNNECQCDGYTNMCKEGVCKYVQIQICANTNISKYKYLQTRGCAARIGHAAWRATYAFHPLLVAVDWQKGTTQIIRWGAQFPCLWFIVFPPSGSGMAAKNPSHQSLPCSDFALAKFQIPNYRFQIPNSNFALAKFMIKVVFCESDVEIHKCYSSIFSIF